MPNLSAQPLGNSLRGDIPKASPGVMPFISGSAAPLISRPGTITTGNYICCTWSPEQKQYVAVAQSTADVLISRDGIRWNTYAAAMPASTTWWAMSWAPERKLYVAVSIGGQIATSQDGVVWTSRSGGAANQTAAAWSAERGVFASVRSSAVALTSQDGITWVSRSLPVSASWQDCIWVRELGRFVAVAATGETVWSSNGETWVQGQKIPSGSVYRSLAWAPSIGTLVAVGTNCAAWSRNGRTWNVANQNPSGTLFGVTWLPGRNFFCAPVNNSQSKMWFSYDGARWFSRSSPSSAHGRPVASAQRQEVLVLPQGTSVTVLV